jgi:sortase A
MKKFINKFAAILIILFTILAPATGANRAEASVANDYPVWIIAPSISLSSPIQGVGINSKGEMDVPSGKSNNVGWYKHGVMPGSSGTAVLDAHVFAAFKNLSKIKPGNYIYVYMSSGNLLSFRVTNAQTYSLNKLSSSTLFANTTSRQINLITCAGELTRDKSTYTHRLIVSAKLV